MKKFLRTCAALTLAATMTVTGAIVAYAAAPPAYGTVDGSTWSAEVEIVGFAAVNPVVGTAEISLSYVPIITANEDISQEEITQYGQYFSAIHQVPTGTKMEVTQSGGSMFSLELPEGRTFNEPEFEDTDVSMVTPESPGVATYDLSAGVTWDYTFEAPGRYIVSMIATHIIIDVDGENTATQPAAETPAQPVQPIVTGTPSNMPVFMQYFLSSEFSVYNEPNAALTPVETFSPQTVGIVIMNNDGWCLIRTFLGDKWVNIPALATAGAAPPQPLTTPAVQQSVLLDVPTLNQNELGYPTGCEVTALAMMMSYTVDVDVHVLFTQIPYSENPLEGYRGDPKTTGGFTVLPSALTQVTEQYLGSYHNMAGGTMDDLKTKLAANAPVVAWVVGFGFNVHAICLTGYDEKGFYYNDPLTGAKNDHIDYDSFYKMWNESIKDNRLNVSYEPCQALSYFPDLITGQ